MEFYMKQLFTDDYSLKFFFREINTKKINIVGHGNKIVVNSI